MITVRHCHDLHDSSAWEVLIDTPTPTQPIRLATRAWRVFAIRVAKREARRYRLSRIVVEDIFGEATERRVKR